MANYGQHRRKIRSGDLLGWSHREGWFSSWHSFKVNLVRLLTRSAYSHVGVALSIGGRLWVVESVTPLVRLVPLSSAMPFYHATVPGLEWGDEATEFALSFVGNPRFRYSQLEAIKARLGMNDIEDDALECGEFVQILYARAGVFLPGQATPAEVMRDVLERGGVVSFVKGGLE